MCGDQVAKAGDDGVGVDAEVAQFAVGGGIADAFQREEQQRVVGAGGR